MTPDEIAGKIASVPYWHHRIELAPGVFTPGQSNCRALLDRLELPETMQGLRVLDVGTRDGFFAFEMERRGAEVVAVDYMEASRTGFAVASEALGSQVQYVHENLLNLREELGQFDVVLFLGILYHLRDPMWGLEVMRSRCRGEIYVETFVCDEEIANEAPVMRFYPRDSLRGDASNYWAPNMSCLQAMLEENRFRVVRQQRLGTRAIVVGAVCEDPALAYHAQIARGRIVKARSGGPSEVEELTGGAWRHGSVGWNHGGE